jgi:hypothetical protein
MREAIEISHVALDLDDKEHHMAIGVTDFPMDEVMDRLDGEEPAALDKPEPMALAADGLAEVLHWVWQPEKHRRPKLRAAFHRFVSLSATLNPDLLNRLSYRELGLMLGCTRAALSKQSILFCRQFGGLQFRRQHGGRGNMRTAAIVSHQKRHNETNPEKPS